MLASKAIQDVQATHDCIVVHLHVAGLLSGLLSFGRVSYGELLVGQILAPEHLHDNLELRHETAVPWHTTI